MVSSFAQLGLGTAQLGMDYGIANTKGKPSLAESFQILDFAKDKGFYLLDTAPAYEDSESVIGEWRERNLNSFRPLRILNKYPARENNRPDIIRSVVEKSLSALSVECFDYYLIHDHTKVFEKGLALINILSKLKKEGLFRKLGVSVYTVEEAEQVLNIPELDVIEFPMNLLDNRFIRNSLLNRMKGRGLALFCRSVFLQGLFFRRIESLPLFFEEIKGKILNLKNIAEEQNMSMAEMAIRYVLNYKELDCLIVGAEKKSQVVECWEAYQKGPLKDSVNERIYEIAMDVSEKMINPSMWRMK